MHNYNNDGRDQDDPRYDLDDLEQVVYPNTITDEDELMDRIREEQYDLYHEYYEDQNFEGIPTANDLPHTVGATAFYQPKKSWLQSVTDKLLHLMQNTIPQYPYNQFFNH